MDGDKWRRGEGGRGEGGVVKKIIFVLSPGRVGGSGRVGVQYVVSWEGWGFNMLSQGCL